MFKIECLVEDKKLATVLHMLTGHVYNLKPPVPVKNAEVKNGTVKSTAVEGKSSDLVFDKIKRKRIVGANDIRTVLGEVGRSPDSTWSIITEMVKAKQLRRLSAGQYKVNGHG